MEGLQPVLHVKSVPLRWYQPDEANQRCISCGTGATTMSAGAQNQDQCSEYILPKKSIRMTDFFIGVT